MTHNSQSLEIEKKKVRVRGLFTTPIRSLASVNNNPVHQPPPPWPFLIWFLRSMVSLFPRPYPAHKHSPALWTNLLQITVARSVSQTAIIFSRWVIADPVSPMYPTAVCSINFFSPRLSFYIYLYMYIQYIHMRVKM